MRFICATIICGILLCGCSPKATESFFDYQNNEFSFECKLTYNGHENEVKVTMSAPNEAGERETVIVEYISPEIIKGYTLEKSGGQYKGKMGDIEIPFGERAAGVVKAIEGIFSLGEDMLSGIETAENGMTEAEFLSESVSGKVVMDENGSLSSIEASFTDGDSLEIKIKANQ